MKRYECLFFDLDHTLIDTLGQYAKGLKIVLKRMYGNDVPEDYQHHFMKHHNALWKQYDKREITMQELRRERFLRAWKDFDVVRSIEEADAFHEAYDATFESTLEAFPGTLEMLEQLAPTHRLGVITNGSPDLQWRKTNIVGLQQFFRQEDIIISADVGAAKPHPSVYEAACRKLGVSKDEAIMIGDNYLSDVKGARDFGMAAIWYVPDDNILQPQSQYMQEETPLRKPEQVVEAIAQLEANLG